MARPRKPDEERRTETLSVRLTPDERLALQAEAERLSLTLAHLCRERLIEGRVIVREYRRMAPSDALALARVGTNLNQIARQLNSLEEIVLDDLHAAIREVRAILARTATATVDELTPDPRPTRPAKLPDGPYGP